MPLYFAAIAGITKLHFMCHSLSCLRFNIPFDHFSMPSTTAASPSPSHSSRTWHLVVLYIAHLLLHFSASLSEPCNPQAANKTLLLVSHRLVWDYLSLISLFILEILWDRVRHNSMIRNFSIQFWGPNSKWKIAVLSKKVYENSQSETSNFQSLQIAYTLKHLSSITGYIKA